MFNLFRYNYLLFLDFFLRIILSVLLPKLFDPADYAGYNYQLVLVFWFLILDFGSSLGFSLRLIRKYNKEYLNIGYVASSFIFSLIFSSIFIVIFFIFLNKNPQISLESFWLTFFFLSLYSFLSTAFKSIGLVNTDFLGRVFTSSSLLILLILGFNLSIHIYILIPYAIACIFYIVAALRSQGFFFLMPRNFIKYGLQNVNEGFVFYLTNSLLIAYSLMDKIVFSNLMNKHEYGNYLFCYSLSSLHILVQGVIASKYYRMLLSNDATDQRKKWKLLLVTTIGHLILSCSIIIGINLTLFEKFYSKYQILNKYIYITEGMCIIISILTLLYLILNSQKVNKLFLLISYVVPIFFFSLYKLKLIENIYFWLVFYLIELVIACCFSIRNYFLKKANIL